MIVLHVHISELYGVISKFTVPYGIAQCYLTANTSEYVLTPCTLLRVTHFDDHLDEQVHKSVLSRVVNFWEIYC